MSDPTENLEIFRAQRLLRFAQIGAGRRFGRQSSVDLSHEQAICQLNRWLF